MPLFITKYPIVEIVGPLIRFLDFEGLIVSVTNQDKNTTRRRSVRKEFILICSSMQ